MREHTFGVPLLGKKYLALALGGYSCIYLRERVGLSLGWILKEKFNTVTFLKSNLFFLSMLFLKIFCEPYTKDSNSY